MSKNLNDLTPDLKKLFVNWARSKGITAPSSDEAMDLLVSQFHAELALRAHQVAGAANDAIGAAGDQTYNNDPIARMQPQLNILHDAGGMIEVADVDDGEPDDFKDLVRARNRAMEQAGGDDLAAEIIHRDGVHGELKDQAAFTRTNPVSALQGVLGGQAIVQSNTPVAAAPMVASWTGDDSEALPVTVSLGSVGTLPDGNLAAQVRPFAVVSWGTTNYLLAAEIDIGVGTQLTIGGSHVQVAVGMDNCNQGNQGSATLTAMLAFHATVRTSPLTRTRYLDPLNGGTAQTVNVPPFAKNLLLYTNGVTATYTISFNDITGSQIYSYTFAAGTVMTVPIPLSGDITNITVTNTAGGTSSVRLVFGLAL